MWYCVCDKTTGEARSWATVLAPTEVLAARHLAAIAVGETAPDLARLRWDAGTRQLVARVLVDRLQEFAADTDMAALWTLLTTDQRTALRTALARLVGTRRFRHEDEPYAL